MNDTNSKFAGYQWYNAQNKAKEAVQQSAIALAQISESSLLSNKQLEALIVYSCNRLRVYLQSNSNVSDRTLCDDIPTKSD